MNWDFQIEWFGAIPATWSINKIGSLYALRNEKVSDKDFMPLSVTMKGVVPQLDTAAKTNNGDDRKLVRKGDFAINSRSDRRGSCGVSDFDGSVSLINTVLMPRNEMNPIYYNWLFHTSLFADEFYKWGHGIVDDLWTTRWQEMKNIFVPIPPLPTQQRIADFLDRKCAEIDELAALQETMIAELKRYKQSVITEAVTKGLDPNVPMKDSGVEWIGEVPEGWEVKKVKQLLKKGNNNLKVGPFGSALSGNDFKEEGYWVYSQRTVLDSNFLTNNTFVNKDKFEELQSFQVFPGDILITTRGSIGKISVVPVDAPAGILHPCIIRFVIDQDLFCISLLKHIFNESGFISRQISYQSNSTTIDVLYSNTLKNIILPSPPLAEQQAIADYLDEKCAEIDELIAIKQQKIEQLKEYKKSVIFEYVTGKRRSYN